MPSRTQELKSRSASSPARHPWFPSKRPLLPHSGGNARLFFRPMAVPVDLNWRSSIHRRHPRVHLPCIDFAKMMDARVEPHKRQAKRVLRMNSLYRCHCNPLTPVGRWLLDRAINPPIKSGEGDDRQSVRRSPHPFSLAPMGSSPRMTPEWINSAGNRYRASGRQRFSRISVPPRAGVAGRLPASPYV
jgi:hypothetical protein